MIGVSPYPVDPLDLDATCFHSGIPLMVSLKEKLDSHLEAVELFRRDSLSCLEWLNKTYQASFQIWEWRGAWNVVPSNLPKPRPDFEIMQCRFIDDIPEQTRYRVVPLDQRMALVVIPIERTGVTQIAVGVIPRPCAEQLPAVIGLLKKQKHQTRLVLEQHRLLEYYASYASLDFEELGWFGSLTENMAFLESDHTLTPAARQALTGLKDFIQAESVTLVLSDPTIPGRIGNYRHIFNIGRQELDAAKVSDLLSLAGPNFFCESYINNHLQSEQGFDRSEFDSVIIIPALCNHRCFGWLMAVSRFAECHADPGRWDLAVHPARNFNSKTTVLMESAASVLATQAHNLMLISEQQTLLIGTVRSLVNTIDAKDEYTCGHSDRVAQLAKTIATQYGLSEQECQKIYLAGLLHDIGKIGVRDEVLQKPGDLTPEEFAEIKMHPVYGYEILKHLHHLQHVLPGVMHHHESWDGSGYPHGLKQEEIPLAARILAVADAYDAMTSDRPYRRGMPPRKAEVILRQGAGRQWDPMIVAAFFQSIKKVQRIIKSKAQRSYLPVNKGEYVFDDDLLPEEDLVSSAVLTTTSLSDIQR